MDALSGRGFKDKVREKQQSDKQKRILERTTDRLIGVCHFDKRDSQRGVIKCADRSTGTFGRNPAGNERYGPLSSKALCRDSTLHRQKAPVETRTRPVALCREMRALAVGQDREPLCAGKTQVSGDVERRIWLGQIGNSYAKISQT